MKLKKIKSDFEKNNLTNLIELSAKNYYGDYTPMFLEIFRKSIWYNSLKNIFIKNDKERKIGNAINISKHYDLGMDIFLY